MSFVKTIGVISVIIIVYWLFGRCDEEKNVSYIRNTLGSIAIQYYERFGVFPDHLEEAMDKLDISLSHRGDLYGRGVAYKHVEWLSDEFAINNLGYWHVYRNGEWSMVEETQYNDYLEKKFDEILMKDR